MNLLSREQQIAAISALVEGVSIRATERLTGIHRDTIMRLGVRIGEGCAAVHDHLFHSLQIGWLELDEVWSYIGKKQKRVTPEDEPEKGDAYTFIGLDRINKAIISYRVLPGRQARRRNRQRLCDGPSRADREPAAHQLGRLHGLS